MRKILLFTVLAFLLSSCKVKTPYMQYSALIDFTEFTNNGFFITESNSVSFDYTPIGSVQSVVRSGHEIIKQDESVEEREREDVYSYQDLGKMKLGKYVHANANAAIAEMVSAAKELGANGVINLQIEYFPGNHDKYGNAISHSSYTASGMAIKQ